MFQFFDTSADGSKGPERVAALRRFLDRKGLTGFLVPRTDAHQGETVAPSEARLAWLAGFTGSAGIAVVLASRAALFVDGRYTLQAADEVASETFEIVPIHKTSVPDWLGAEIGAHDVIGYDPWLHGKEEIERLDAAVSGAGARLLAMAENPIDRLWEDRPPQPGGAMVIHEEAIAGESAASKRRRLGGELAAEGVDAALISLPDSLAWLLNIRGSDLSHVPVTLGFGMLHADGTVEMFTDPDKADGTVLEHLGNGVSLSPSSALDTRLGGLAGQTIRLDRRTAPVRFAQRLTEAGAKIDWGADPCIAAKAQKTEAELAGMTAAHIRDGAAMARFLHWLDRQPLDAGLTEIALVQRLEAFRAEAGIVDISFDTICGSGPNGAIVHYRVTRDTDRTLVPGEPVLIDSGGQYPDGTTDITRTVPFGPVMEQAVRPFTLVLKGMIALTLARWPEGMAGRDLDPLARAALWQAGLDYDHGTGHGVGAYLNVHEGPASISRKGEVALAPGMILSNEPGYYRTGAFGIRIENLVTVTTGSVPQGGDRPMLGFQTLTLCPIDRRMIDPALLTPVERTWLDGYHAQVAETLMPLLEDEAERSWLSAATAPL
ncbi:MAG: aminopeptidase P family protein [Pseudomonadota bacterium]